MDQLSRESPHHPHPDPLPPERLSVFTYVQVEQAPLYRALMRCFVEAKARFTLNLRPREVAALLAERFPGLLPEHGAGAEDTDSGTRDEASIDRALDQLVKWGNLTAHADTADVATVEDFYRRRQLYQLTPGGEAAEHALETFHQHLEQPGELQTAALHDICEQLEELYQLATAESLDQAKVHRALRSLVARFDELTRRSQAFLGSLQRKIDLQEQTLEDFLAYKEILIGYLDRFVHELVMATAEIVGLLRRLEESGTERLLSAAASRELSDALEVGDEQRERVLHAWRQRWRGLRGWFLRPEGVSQAEVLRARARSAIPALLGAVAGLHDRRLTRSNRKTDLLTLARWFAQCDHDADAHRLWRAAFGLHSSRHLRIDALTLEQWDQQPVASHTSWLEAPPLRLTPRLRKTGRAPRRRAIQRVLDRSREKELLARMAEEEAAQIAAARRQLVHHQPILLSHLERLDRDAFILFLDLLGEALARRVDPTRTVVATSSDGALEITLEPLEGGGLAVLETPDGFFTGRDHKIRIVESVTGEELGT